MKLNQKTKKTSESKMIDKLSKSVRRQIVSEVLKELERNKPGRPDPKPDEVVTIRVASLATKTSKPKVKNIITIFNVPRKAKGQTEEFVYGDFLKARERWFATK